MERDDTPLAAAGGWCAPTHVSSGQLGELPLSPTGFIPLLADVVVADSGVLARWDEEDRWLREQLTVARGA